MNPFANPAMFEQMKNMNPDMMRKATESMNSMSDDDLRRMGANSGMNFSPEMMRQASSMFKNMDDSQMKNMMNMAGSMGAKGQMPQQNSQAQQQNQKPAATTQKQEKKPDPPAETSLYPEITKSKNDGNAKFKIQDWEGASSKYLEAIISIDEARLSLGGSKMHEKELNELEINCRNNYCSVRAKQNDFHTMIIHSQAVLKIDQDNVKAIFRQGQAYFGLKKYERAITFLKSVNKSSPSDEIIANLYKQCEIEVNKINEAKQAAEQKKEEEKPKKVEETQNEKKLKQPEEVLIPEKKVAPRQETEKSSKREEVVIQEEKPAPKTVPAVPQPPTQTFPKVDPNQVKMATERMKGMSDSELNMVSEQMKNMDDNTLRQMYKSQGMDISDDQLKSMRSMISPSLMRQAASMNPEQLTKLQSAQPAQPQAMPSVDSMDPEFIKQKQSELKNLDDNQLKSMSDMMKNMDNSFLKQMYQQKGMNLSDDQINMMKNMITPDMIKATSSMNPDQMMGQMGGAPQRTSSSTSSNSNSTLSSSSTNASELNQSTTETQQQQQPTGMPDNMNMEGLMQNTGMIETAINMILQNPGMLRMVTGQLGENHPVSKYISGKTDEELKSLANKLSYLVPVFKYGYKAVQFVQKYKASFFIIIIALVVKYLFF